MPRRPLHLPHFDQEVLEHSMIKLNPNQEKGPSNGHARYHASHTRDKQVKERAETKAEYSDLWSRYFLTFGVYGTFNELNKKGRIVFYRVNITPFRDDVLSPKINTGVSPDTVHRYAHPCDVLRMRKGCGAFAEEARKSVSTRQNQNSKQPRMKKAQ